MDKRLLTTKDLAEYMSISLGHAREYGKKAGATRWVGRKLLFDRRIIDRALDKLEEGGNILAEDA